MKSNDYYGRTLMRSKLATWTAVSLSGILNGEFQVAIFSFKTFTTTFEEQYDSLLDAMAVYNHLIYTMEQQDVS